MTMLSNEQQVELLTHCFKLLSKQKKTKMVVLIPIEKR